MTRSKLTKVQRAARTNKIIVASGLALGLITSAAFNIISVAATSGSPVAMIMAGVWPTATAQATMIMERVTALPRWVRFGLVGTVAALGMVISFIHTHHVMIMWGESPVSAVAAPLVIDGLMTLSGAALLAMQQPARRKRPARKSAPQTTRRLKAA